MEDGVLPSHLISDRSDVEDGMGSRGTLSGHVPPRDTRGFTRTQAEDFYSHTHPSTPLPPAAPAAPAMATHVK